MRVITKKRLEAFWLRYPRAKKELLIWHDMAVGAAWKTPVDMKSAFGQRVDFVLTRNNHTVAIFDVANDRCRLITAIHYLNNHPINGRVYVLRVLTHEEYDSQNWKDEL